MDKEIEVKGFVIQPRHQFKTLVDKLLYQHFMEQANYEGNGRCQRGELIISIISLVESTGWSYGVIRGALHRLQDQGLIQFKSLTRKRGTIVTIPNYSEFQTLDFYKKINKQNNNNKTNNEQINNKQDNEKSNDGNPSHYKENEGSKSSINKQDNEQLTNKKQIDNKQINNALTAFITSLNNINNITNLKDFLETAPVKSLNLSSTEEIKTFVDFAFKINDTGVNRKITAQYFDTIRMTRSTCRISAKILANLLDKFSKYDQNQLHHAMLLHCLEHDDKREQYTLGILRNTDPHKASRELMILINKNPKEDMVHEVSKQRVGDYQFGF